MKKILISLLFISLISSPIYAKDIAYLYKSNLKNAGSPDQAFTFFELHKDNAIHTVNFDGYYIFQKNKQGISSAHLETSLGEKFLIKKDANYLRINQQGAEKPSNKFKIKFKPLSLHLPSDLHSFFKSGEKKVKFSFYMHAMEMILPMLLEYQADEKLLLSGKTYETQKYKMSVFYTAKERALRKKLSWFEYYVWWDNQSQRIVKKQYKLAKDIEVINEFDKVLSPQSGIEIVNKGKTDVSLKFQHLRKTR